MATSKKPTRTSRARTSGKKNLNNARLEALVDEALVDAYGQSEQATGLFTMIEGHLALPFTTEILGVEVSVVKIDLTDRDDIVALCRRGKERQSIPLLNLPRPSSPPEGWERIEAYRRWARVRK